MTKTNQKLICDLCGLEFDTGGKTMEMAIEEMKQIYGPDVDPDICIKACALCAKKRLELGEIDIAGQNLCAAIAAAERSFDEDTRTQLDAMVSTVMTVIFEKNDLGRKSLFQTMMAFHKLNQAQNRN